MDPAAVAAQLDVKLSPRGWMVGFGLYSGRFWARWAWSQRPVWLIAETSEELQERIRTHHQAERLRGSGPGGATPLGAAG